MTPPELLYKRVVSQGEECDAMVYIKREGGVTSALTGLWRELGQLELVFDTTFR